MPQDEPLEERLKKTERTLKNSLSIKELQKGRPVIDEPRKEITKRETDPVKRVKEYRKHYEFGLDAYKATLYDSAINELQQAVELIPKDEVGFLEKAVSLIYKAHISSIFEAEDIYQFELRLSTAFDYFSRKELSTKNKAQTIFKKYFRKLIKKIYRLATYSIHAFFFGTDYSWRCLAAENFLFNNVWNHYIDALKRKNAQVDDRRFYQKYFRKLIKKAYKLATCIGSISCSIRDFFFGTEVARLFRFSSCDYLRYLVAENFLFNNVWNHYIDALKRKNAQVDDRRFYQKYFRKIMKLYAKRTEFEQLQEFERFHLVIESIPKNETELLEETISLLYKLYTNHLKDANIALGALAYFSNKVLSTKNEMQVIFEKYIKKLIKRIYRLQRKRGKFNLNRDLVKTTFRCCEYMLSERKDIQRKDKRFYRKYFRRFGKLIKR